MTARPHPRDRRRDAERPGDGLRSGGQPAGADQGRRSSRTCRVRRAAASRIRSSTGGRSPRRAGSCGRLPEGRRDALAGVALTTQRGTIVVTDEHGEPLRRAMVWLDRCRAEGLPRLGGKWGLAFKARGRHARRSRPSRPKPRRTSCSRTEPETWAKVRHYLFLSGFLVHRLTGRFVDSVAAQVGYVPFDYKALAWAKPGDWKWLSRPDRARAGCRSWCRRAACSARSSPAAADATGIPAGLPLVAAAGDKACEVLGSGALDPHVGAISPGHDRLVQHHPRALRRGHPDRAAVPGRGPGPVQPRGQRLPRLLDDRVVQARVRRGGGGPGAPSWASTTESLFDELVAATPPGSMGLVLQPYWSPGVRVPGPEAKGAVIGWGDVHTRAHLYRAILEGLAYALREGAERTVRADEGAGDRGARLGRRLAEPGCRPADRGHLRAARVAPAHARDLGPWRGDRRRGRPRPPPLVRGGGSRDDPRRRDPRPGPSHPRLYEDLYRERLPAACTSGCSRSTRRSAGSPATRP